MTPPEAWQFRGRATLILGVFDFYGLGVHIPAVVHEMEALAQEFAPLWFRKTAAPEEILSEVPDDQP